MAPSDEGIKNEALKQALDEALAGEPRRLEDLLARHGGLPGPRPNLKLAAAFGAELGAVRQNVVPLLTLLAACDAAADDARAFLPVAGAHGWAGRIRAGRDVEPAWAALADLALDERPAVNQGTHDAVVALAIRPHGADQALDRAVIWLELGDREGRYAGMALMLDVLGEPGVIASLSDHEGLLAYLTRVLEEMEDAPRSAERSVFRRRTLTALSRTIPAVVAHGGTGDRAARWLEEECGRAQRVDVRQTLSQAIVRLRNSASGQRAAVADGLGAALAASAKPLRHAARVRPGTGRGKKTRAIR